MEDSSSNPTMQKTSRDYHVAIASPPNVSYVVMWINICICLPLTILIICCLCCLVRKDHVPTIYVANLLVSNLIQISSTIVWVAKPHETEIIKMSLFTYCFGLLANLGFRACVALERYFFIACPLSHCIRQTKVSLAVCAVVWVLCVVSLVLTKLSDFLLPISTLIPLPLFIFCLAGTLKALSTATSVTAEEKRRIVGVLVLLLLNYTLTLLPTIIIYIYFIFPLHRQGPLVTEMLLILIRLSPFADLILFVSMQKGPVDKLLACLCCCRMDSTAADDSSRSSV